MGLLILQVILTHFHSIAYKNCNIHCRSLFLLSVDVTNQRFRHRYVASFRQLKPRHMTWLARPLNYMQRGKTILIHECFKGFHWIQFVCLVQISVTFIWIPRTTLSWFNKSSPCRFNNYIRYTLLTTIYLSKISVFLMLLTFYAKRKVYQRKPDYLLVIECVFCCVFV